VRNTTLYTNKPKTFRRSSTSIFGKWGDNLQNIKKNIRSIYIPDGFTKELEAKCQFFLETGETFQFTEEELVSLKVLLQTDQSGAEALIVAYECKDGDYRKLFKHNIKPHVYVALKLFPDVWKKKMREKAGLDIDIDLLNITPIELLRSNPEFKELDLLIKDSDNWGTGERYYYYSKQTCHSGNYQVGWHTFIMNTLEKSGGKVVLKRQQGEHFLNTYHSLFPEIMERNFRIRCAVDQYKLIYNIFGFPYQITNYDITEKTYKEYYAWPSQSAVGEITRMAFTNLQTYIEEHHRKWDILADTHDSIMQQVPLLEAKEGKQKMQEYMNIEMTSPVDNVKFNMKSECQIGFNWGPFDKHNPDKNRLGLREVNWL
jgi:hypothetical protein